VSARGSRRRQHIPAWLAVCAGPLLGCQHEPSGFLSCGNEVCNPREECVDPEGDPHCRCQVGFDGGDCEFCASGYRASAQGGCEPIPIDCEEDPAICGEHGECVEAGRGDSCRCDDRYTGRLCELCADGFQDNDLDETCEPTCGTAELDCEPPRECSDESGLAVCVCPVGQTGDDCELCALGYRDNGGSCTPTCAALELECDSHEACVDTGDSAHCECQTGYAGPSCSGCAEGYSDALREGECLPTCVAAAMGCGGHGECADDVGFAYCACETGFTGPDCGVCAMGHAGDDCGLCSDGYTRAGDGPCEPRCDFLDGCPGERRCVVTADAMSCECPIGYSGSNCTGCDEDYASDGGGNCVAVVDSAEKLLVAGRDAETPAVMAVDLQSGEITLLRSLAVTGLAYDFENDELYAADGGSVGTLDLARGIVDEVTTALADTVGPPLAWDSQRGALLTLAPSSGRPLWRLDPVSGEETVVGETDLDEAYDLAYDAEHDRILIAAEELYAMDLGSGAVSSVGALPDATRGIAFSSDGRLWAVASPELELAEAIVAACRMSAAALGIAGYDVSPGTGIVADDASGEVTLLSNRTSAVEVVAYSGAAGFADERVVSVETSNPEALVCVAVNEEQTRIVVSADVELRALIVWSQAATVEVQLDDTFERADVPVVYAGGEDALWLLPNDSRVRLYSSEEWADRRVVLTATPELPGPGVLHELDPADATSISRLTLRGSAIPLSPASAWLP